MSLTSGRGPLSADPAGRFVPPIVGRPGATAYVEPHPRRVRATLAGATVIDTERALLVHRAGHPPTYAFPADAVGDLPASPEPAAPGHVTVAWDAVDGWLEEEEPVVLHAPNPYHRVEYLRSRRRLRVVLGATTVADTTDTTAVYETALAPRLYVERRHVAAELEVTATTTVCGYKGTATWWRARVGGEWYDDVAWSYEAPRPEALAIQGLLCFEPSRAEVSADFPAP
jgi:uncharacterized protein (DUF427 family)